jgi:3-oxoacyl-(acyl-carrier-protein) synthase
MQLRRMSKAVRMGIGASKIAMQDAGIEKPDALSIGTAMGCLQDTEVFLSKLVEQNEQMLTPTSFIQSTHNTVGGQIALLAGCYGHNLTYVHRGHSFEHAVINTQLYLNDHPGEKMLMGGIDELTDSSIQVLKATGLYRIKRSNENLLNTGEPGSLAGEGATFFIAGKQPSEGAIQIKNISISTPADATAALEKLNTFLTQQNLSPENVDLVMSGWNGDSREKMFYDEVNTLFAGSSIAGFKHLSGEYATASAFGLGMITQIVKKGKVPEFALLNGKQPGSLKNILLINNHMHYFSIWHIVA